MAASTQLQPLWSAVISLIRLGFYGTALALAVVGKAWNWRWHNGKKDRGTHRRRDWQTPQLSWARQFEVRFKLCCSSGLSSLYAYLNLTRSLVSASGSHCPQMICHYFMMRVLYGSSRCAAPVNKKQLHINLSLSHFDNVPSTQSFTPLPPPTDLLARPTSNRFDNNFIMSSSAGVCSG